jgi:hypothetical protein
MHNCGKPSIFSFQGSDPARKQRLLSRDDMQAVMPMSVSIPPLSPRFPIGLDENAFLPFRITDGRNRHSPQYAEDGSDHSANDNTCRTSRKSSNDAAGNPFGNAGRISQEQCRNDAYYSAKDAKNDPDPGHGLRRIESAGSRR